MLYAAPLSQIPAIGLTKISVLLFYKRIFRGPLFSLLTNVLIILVSAWTVAFFFANLLKCVPISESWTSLAGLDWETNSKCIDALPMYLAGPYSDLGLDVLILGVPIPQGISGFSPVGVLCNKCFDYSLEIETAHETEDCGLRHLFAWNYVSPLE
jgi:hypothetical protein